MSLRLDPKVAKVLVTEKISTDELQQMLEHAAITSAGGCNRRYHHWLFDVRDNGEFVREMKTAEPPLESGHDRGQGYMLEPHGLCSGKGCHSCGWWGDIRRWL